MPDNQQYRDLPDVEIRHHFLESAIQNWLTENMGALEVVPKLTSGTMSRIDGILMNKPQFDED